MKIGNASLTLSVASLLLTACAGGVSRQDLNQTIHVQYGQVASVEKVKLESNVGSSAVMGGLIGAATSGKHNQGEHALEGAAALGLLTAFAEGDRQATAYQILLSNGSTIKIITEQEGAQPGDCVAIEQGRHSNVRRVANTFCHAPNSEAVSHPQVVQHAQNEAEQCLAAKDAAMAAKTNDELELASRKVQIFCGD